MNNLVTFTAKYPQFPSDLLVKFRHRSGLSQSQLAHLLGLKSERMVLYWEGGYSLPTAARLRKIIELFLANGGFLPGQEISEIEQLWTVAKNFYDNTRGKNLPYPVFDHAWVAALVISFNKSNKFKIAPTAEDKPELVKFTEATADQGQEEESIHSDSNLTFTSPARADLAGSAGTSSQVFTPPTNLSRFQTATTLLGREKELQDLEALLNTPEGSVIVLTGPGGVGKTCLALVVAAEVLTSFKDGIYFVNLADVTGPEQVPTSIGQVLNLKVQSTSFEEEIETISQHLTGKKVLLILDNFEQLAKSAALFNRLFSIVRNEKLKILITSRVDLNIYGEQRYGLEPLELPVINCYSPAGLPFLLEEHFQLLKDSSPIRLFVKRAKLVRPDFTLTPHNALAVARICELVDGLPLAIELAAARIQLFTPEALCKRLEENAASPQSSYQEKAGEKGTGSGYAVLKWLNNGYGFSDKRRQQGLRSTLDWSYSLLGKDQQSLFKKLAVFRDGFTLAAVCAICYPNSNSTTHPEINNEPAEAEILNNLTGLINSSLLKSTYDQDGEPRFVMLKTISEFATEQLEQGNNNVFAQQLRQRHAFYYLRLAEEALPNYRGADQVAWYEKTGYEHSNMLAALEYLLKTSLLKPAARLVYALNSFWFRRSLISQGMHWARLAIAAINKFEKEAGLAFSNGGVTTGKLDNFSNSVAGPKEMPQETAGQQESSMFADTEDLKLWQGRLLWQLGTYKGTGSNLDEALQMIREGLKLSIAVKDTAQIIQDYHSLGYIYMNQGRIEEAVEYMEQGIALASSDKNSYSFMLAGILTNLGIINRDRQKYEEAEAILHEGLALCRQHGYKSSELMFLGNLGQISLYRNDPDKAENYFTQVLNVAKEIEAPYLAAITHMNLAGLGIFNKVNIPKAKFHLKQALLLNLERGFKLGQITVIILLGVILVRQGELKLAVELAGTIEAELQGLGQKLLGQELQWYQTFREEAATGLGQENGEVDRYYNYPVINRLPFSQVIALVFQNL